MIRLTETGRDKAEKYIRSLKEEREKILLAHKDTADNTHIPTLKEIENDIEENEDDYGNGCIEYCEYWGATDHYDSEFSLSLTKGLDYSDVTLKFAVLEAIETGSVNLYLFDTERDARTYIEKEFRCDEFELLDAKKDGADATLSSPIILKDGYIDHDVFVKNNWFCGSFDETYYWYQILTFNEMPDAESNYGVISFRFAPGFTAETATWHIRVIKASDDADIQYHITENDGAPVYDGTITVNLDSEKQSFEGLYYEDKEDE